MDSQRISNKVPKLAREGRFGRISEWAAVRLGRSEAQKAAPLTMVEVSKGLPRISGLRYHPEASKSPLGGRIDPHLHHVEEGEALERIARADRFIAETEPSVVGADRGGDAESKSDEHGDAEPSPGSQRPPS